MKNYVVIGASYGIGQHITKQLANQGHRVYAFSRTLPQVQEPNVIYTLCDITTDTIDLSNLPDVLDGFVYCVGSIVLKPFHRLPFSQFEKDMHLNFFAMVKVLQQLIPNLRKASNASVVLFSTVATKLGMPFHTSIASAKAAIEGFAKSLAAEYAPTLRVNVIAPSVTDTPLANRLLSNDAKRQAITERHPLKQIGQPDQVAELATYLLSDKAQWMTGQVIGLDGGIGSLKV